MRRFSAVSFSAMIVSMAIALPLASHAAYGDTSTWLSRIYWGDGKHRTKAFLDFPKDMTVNKKTGAILIADTYNNVIRRIRPDDIVKTAAGNGSYGDKIGGADKANFALPEGVGVGGGAIYVADTQNGKIKKIDDGVVTELVANLNKPQGVDYYNGFVYFLDTGDNKLKKVSKNGGAVTTITSGLNDPKKLDIRSDGKYAFVANSGSHQVLRVKLDSGTIKVIAGSGEVGDTIGNCNNAKFNQIWGIWMHNDDTIYVSDGDGFTDSVKKIDLSGDTCVVSIFTSDAAMESVNFPSGIFTKDGFLFVMSTGLSGIERFELDKPKKHIRFAGADRFNVRFENPVLVGNPKYLVLSKNKEVIYIAENNRIRKIRRDNRGTSSLIAGNVIDNYAKNDTKSFFGESARFSDIPSFIRSKDGTKLFVVDRNNNRIREVIIASGEVKYLTGAGKINLAGGQTNDFQNGEACPNEFDIDVDGCAYFNRPTGSVRSKTGKFMFVADSGNNRIRRVTLTGDNKGKVITIAGSGEAGFADGVGTAAKFNAPVGLARSKGGKVLFVADRDNHRIRKINLETKNVTTLTGTGANGYLDATLDKAIFSFPEWIARGKDRQIYVSDLGSHRIRVIDLNVGVTKLVSGVGERGFKNGSRFETKFNNARGMLPLGGKRLLVAELYNDLIRSIDINGVAPFTEPAPDVTAVVPNLIGKEWFSGSTASVQFSGSNFRHGMTAKVGPYDAVNVYVTNSNSIVVEMPISSMPAGYYTVQVRNSDGQTDELYRGLSITQGGLVPNVDYTP